MCFFGQLLFYSVDYEYPWPTQFTREHIVQKLHFRS